MSMDQDLFALTFHWKFYLTLYCTFSPVLVVVGGPFMIGKFSWMSLYVSFQIISPILLPVLIPSHYSLFCILRVLGHSRGKFIVSVCCILVVGKNIQKLCFVHLVLKYRMHPNKYGESFRFFCIMLLRLDVSRCNLKTVLPVSRFPLSDWYAPLPVSSVP